MDMVGLRGESNTRADSAPRIRVSDSDMGMAEKAKDL